MKRVPRRLASATPEEVRRLGRTLSHQTVEDGRRFTCALRRAEAVVLQATYSNCARDIGAALYVAEVPTAHPCTVVSMAAWLTCFAWPRLHVDEIRELTRRWDDVMNDSVGQSCWDARLGDVARLLGYGQEEMATS